MLRREEYLRQKDIYIVYRIPRSFRNKNRHYENMSKVHKEKTMVVCNVDVLNVSTL